jgi:predicted CXXCH cytochrome family protein
MYMLKCFLLFVICVFMIPMQVGAENGPAIKKDCKLCHGNHGMSVGNQGMLLISPVPDLCIGCHRDRVGGGEHVIGVTPSESVAEELPLDSDGKVTCTTCHTPHVDGAYPSMLRKQPEEICQSCHNM